MDAGHTRSQSPYLSQACATFIGNPADHIGACDHPEQIAKARLAVVIESTASGKCIDTESGSKNSKQNKKTHSYRCNQAPEHIAKEDADRDLRHVQTEADWFRLI